MAFGGETLHGLTPSGSHSHSREGGFEGGGNIAESKPVSSGENNSGQFRRG